MPHQSVKKVLSGITVALLLSVGFVITAFGQTPEQPPSQPSQPSPPAQQPAQPSQPEQQSPPAQPSQPVQQVQPSQPAQPSPAQIYRPQQLPPKQPGVVRIGVIRPLSLIGPEATFDTSAATRDLFVSFLGGPLAEVVPIDSRVQIQVVAESKLKECDYVIYSAIARNRGTNSVSKIIGTAAPVMGLLPAAGALTGTAKDLGSTVSQADRLLKAATDLSGQIKSKDEVVFEYKLVVTGSTAPMTQKLFKAKAESDGDSVISTLLADAANSILETIVNKKP